MTSRLHRSVALFIGLVILLAASGCSTIAKQTFYEMRGAEGKVIPNAPLGPTELAPYNGLQFEPVTTRLSTRIVPRPVLTAYDRQARLVSAAFASEYGGTPSLRAETEILFMQEKGILSQAQLLTWVQLFDGSQLKLDAVVKTESKSFRAGGEDDLAEAACRALTDLIADHKKEVERQQEAAE